MCSQKFKQFTRNFGIGVPLPQHIIAVEPRNQDIKSHKVNTLIVVITLKCSVERKFIHLLIQPEIHVKTACREFCVHVSIGRLFLGPITGFYVRTVYKPIYYITTLY